MSRTVSALRIFGTRRQSASMAKQIMDFTQLSKDVRVACARAMCELVAARVYAMMGKDVAVVSASYRASGGE